MSQVVQGVQEACLELSRITALPFNAAWDFRAFMNSNPVVHANYVGVDSQRVIATTVAWDEPPPASGSSGVHPVHEIAVNGKVFWVLYEPRSEGTMFKEFLRAIEESLWVNYRLEEESDSIQFGYAMPVGTPIEDTEMGVGQAICSSFMWHGVGVSRRGYGGHSVSMSKTFFNNAAETIFPSVPAAAIEDGSGGYRVPVAGERATAVATAVSQKSYVVVVKGFVRAVHGLSAGSYWLDAAADNGLTINEPQFGIIQRILEVSNSSGFVVAIDEGRVV